MAVTEMFFIITASKFSQNDISVSLISEYREV